MATEARATPTSSWESTRSAERQSVLDRARFIYAQNPILKPKDIKQFFVEVEEKQGSAQVKATCMFCKKAFCSTGMTRLVEHMAECLLCSVEVKESCKKLRDSVNQKRKVKRDEREIMATELQVQEELMKAQKLTLRQEGIRAGFRLAECDLADRAVAKFFYANGVSFNVAGEGGSSLCYFREMCDAIRKTPASYVPPSRGKLAGSLLDSCYDDLQHAIRRRETCSSSAELFGYSYTQDGWDSVDHLPLINSAYVSAGVGGVYLRSVDTSGAKKDAEYVAALMISDIYTIGCTNVVTVVTDTCAVMEKAWTIVMDEFPWISCLPCVPHVVSLLMKDVAKINDVSNLIKDETTVVGWFSNHQKPLAILRSKVHDMLHKSCELVKAGATRFGTHTLVGERLLELKGALQASVVDPEYVKENYKDKASEQEMSNCEVRTREHKGGTAKKLVLDDNPAGFWERVEQHIHATKPMYKLLRRHDTSAPSVGKVYHGFFELGGHLQGLQNCPYQEKLTEAHEERWAYGHVPFFGAAYVLDPEYVDHQQFTNAEVVDAFNTTMEKLAILLQVRRRREEYAESWALRKQMIEGDKMLQKTLDNYPSYPDTKDVAVKDFCKAVNQELAIYKNKKGDFAREWLMDSACDMPAHLWWQQNGGSTPHLQKIAMLVLSQPASASLCERINSEFGFIKDRRRNRLQHARASKLVSMFHNFRMVQGLNAHQYEEPAVEWSDIELKSGVTKWGLPAYE